MINRSAYFKIGVFVIAAVALILIGVVALGVGALLEKGIPAEAYFDESVQGIDVGSKVKRRGVTVGVVESIGFANQLYSNQLAAENVFEYGRYIVVRMRLNEGALPGASKEVRLAYLRRLTEEGVRIRLASAGLTGPAYLEIDSLAAASFPPLEYPWKPELPVIASAPSVLDKLFTTAQDVLTRIAKVNFEGIAESLDEVLDTANTAIADADIPALRERAVALLDELRRAGANVNQVLDSDETTALIRDAAAAVASIRRITEDGEGDAKQFLATLPDLTDRATALATRLEAALQGDDLERIIANVRAASDALPPAMVNARRALARIESIMATRQRDLESTVENIREVSANLKEFTGDVSKDPARLIFGGAPAQTAPDRQP